MVHEIQPGDRRTDSGPLVIGSRFTVRNPKKYLLNVTAADGDRCAYAVRRADVCWRADAVDTGTVLWVPILTVLWQIV